MNRTLLTISSIAIISIIAYVVMVYVLDWTQKKAAFIAFGAAGAMILVDVVFAGFKRNRID